MTLRSARARARAAILLSILSSPLLAQDAPDPGPLWDTLAAEWRSAVVEEGVVGASLALVHRGEIVRFETEGMASLAEGRPVDRSTIYHWASITKTFTAVAIMQLRDRGLLSLDDPIVDYVPELRDVHNPFGPMGAITIRHLMSHSAGFRGSTWPWGGGEPWHPHEPTEWSQLVAMIPYTEIRFEPGSRYSYSNPGIVFLGRVIEKLSGDVFEAYIQKNIFRPLGMTDAYFDVTPWGLRRQRSDHYWVRDGRPESGGLDFNTGITVSNGGLNAPVGDLARWLAFLMGTPIEGADFDQVLGRNSLKEMWRTQVPIGDNPMGQESMGLSFFLYQDGDRQIVGHTGTQRAFYSFFYLDDVAKVGVIGAFNTVGTEGGGPDTAALRVRTAEAVVRRLFPLFRQARQ